MSAFGGKGDMAVVVANSKIKIQNFSGALLGPLAQSLFSARVPIAPAPHFFWFSMPCPIRQIHDASDIGTTHRQRCRPQFPLPPICKLDTSPSQFPTVATQITIRLYTPSVFVPASNRLLHHTRPRLALAACRLS